MLARRCRLTGRTDSNPILLGPPLRCNEQVDSDEEEEHQNVSKRTSRGDLPSDTNKLVRNLTSHTLEQRSVSYSAPLKRDVQDGKENSVPLRSEKSHNLENDPTRFRDIGRKLNPLPRANSQQHKVPTPGSLSRERITSSVNTANGGASGLSAMVRNKPITSNSIVTASHGKPPIPNAQTSSKKETHNPEQTFPKATRAASNVSTSYKLASGIEEAAQTYPDSFHQSQIEEQRVSSSQPHRTPTTHPVGSHDSLHKTPANRQNHLVTSMLSRESTDGDWQPVCGAIGRGLNLPQQVVIIPGTHPAPDKRYQKLAMIGMGASSKVGSQYVVLC